MGRLIARNFVTQQPQQAVAIDWSNPITRGLDFISYGDHAYNVVTGSQGSLLVTNGSATKTLTPVGRAINFSGAAASVTHNKSIAKNGGLTVLFLGNPISDPTYCGFAFYQSGSVGSVWVGANTDEYQGTVPGQLCMGLLQDSVNRSAVKVAGAVDGTMSCYLLKKGNGTGAAYKNGLKLGATIFGTLAGAPTAAADTLQIGGMTSNSTTSFNASLALVMVFNRTLTDSEAASLTRNPWQIFQVQKRALTYPLVPPALPPSILAGYKPKSLVNRMQPQQAPVIDWGNPITRGMVSVMWGGDTNPRDLLNPQVSYFRVGASLSQASGSTGTSLPLGQNGVYSGRNDWGRAGVVGNQVSYFTVVTTTAMNAGLLGGCVIGGGYGISLQYANTAEPAWTVKTSTMQYSVGASAGITTPAGFNIHGLVYNTGRLDGYLNGRLRATSGAVGTDLADIAYDTYYGRNTFGGSDPNDGATSAGVIAHMAVAWNRPLSDAEARSFGQNPWQIFKSNSQAVYVETPYVAPAPPTGGMTTRRPVGKMQPQTPKRIDWSNPITRGLQMAVIPGLPVNLVDGVIMTPDTTAAALTVEARKGMQSITNGAYLYPAPASASAPEAKFDTTIMTALLYGYQSTAQNGNISFVRGNGSVQTASTWGVGLHGGSFNGANAVISGTSLSPIAAGTSTTVPRVVVLKGDGSLASLYNDGVLQQTASYTPAAADYNTLPLYRRQVGFGNASQTGGAQTTNPFLGLWWNRPLSDVEIKSISANPWQVFKADTAKYWVETASAQTGIIAASGNSIGTSNVTAISAAIKAAYGSSVGMGTVAGGAGGIVMATGSSTAQAVGAGSAASVMASIGAALGASTVAGVANIIAQSTGAAAGTAVAAGAGRIIFNVAGSSSGTSGTSGTSVSITQATGSAVGSSTTSASVVSIATSNGSSTSAASVIGNGAAIWLVNGTSAGISIVQGSSNSISSAVGAAGNAVGSSTANAVGATIATSSGSATGAANVSGQGRTLAEAIAHAVGSSTASGGGAIIGAAVGSAAGTSNGQAVVAIVFEAAGMSLSAADVNGVAASIQSAIGSANGHAQVSGVTEGGIHYTAKGDKFNITLVFSPYEISLADNPYEISLQPQPFNISKQGE